jgi:hypothetical protein
MPSSISVAAVVAAVFIVGSAITPSANAAPSDDACSLLTQAQVSAAVGVPVGAGRYQGPDKKVCAWNRTGNATEGAKFVTLLLQGLDAFQAGKQAPVKTIVVTPVTGIGDDAYYLAVGDNVGLIVKKGKVAFKVAVYGQLPFEKKQSMEKTLAQQIVPHL